MIYPFYPANREIKGAQGMACCRAVQRDDRLAFPQVVSLTANKTKLDEFSMVFLNNLLSLPLILVLMWYYGELPGVINDPALQASVLAPPSLLQIADTNMLQCRQRRIFHVILGVLRAVHYCELITPHPWTPCLFLLSRWLVAKDCMTVLDSLPIPARPDSTKKRLPNCC